MKHIDSTRTKAGWESFPSLMAFACVTLLLGACMKDERSGQHGTDVEGTHLTGRVISSSAMPIPGVVVSLAKAGITDTTDALGRYHLQKPEALEEEGAAVLDTLYYSKHGQTLARVTVTHWVDSLPDVQVVQRDISGLLEAGSVAITRVEAVLNGDGVDSTSPVTTEFYYNPLTENYSGFMYFPPASGVQSYNVFINVYDEEDRLTARSVTVPFNSFAGNITVPTFSAGNARPVVNAGANRTAPVASTLELQGTADVGFDGSIVKWEWNIGGQGFVETSSGDTVITLPSSRNSAYTNTLRVTDQQGYTAMSTMLVNVTNDNPVITGLADTVVGLNATVTFNVSATDSHGISRFLWDFNGDGTFDDTTTTGTNTWTFPGTSGASKVIVAVEDPYDGVSHDTARVVYLGSAFDWTPSVSGTSQPLNDVTWTGTRLIAVGEEGALLASSTGESWTPLATVTQRPLFAAASSGSQVVVIARGPGVEDTSLFVSSDDGLNWTGHPGAISAVSARNLNWMGGRYIGVSSPGGAPIMSEDGITWTRTMIQGADGFASITWTGMEFVYRGNYPNMNSVSTSPDGATWTTHTAVLPTGAVHLFWIDNEIIAIVGDKRFTSPDGTVWTQAEATGLHENVFVLRAMVWTGEVLVGVGLDGWVTVSPDKGATWTTWKISDQHLLGLTWTGSRLVAVGHNGTILTSP